MSEKRGSLASQGGAAKRVRPAPLTSASSWGGMDVKATASVSTQAEIQQCLAKARRPAPRRLDPQVQDFAFQQVDLDYIQVPFDRNLHEPLGTGTQGDRPMIRIFGVTDEGNSVCAFVHSFEPYFYAKAPEGFTEHDILQFTQALNAAVNSSSRQHAPLYIRHVSIEQKQTIMHYQEQASVPFLKITTVLPSMVPTAKTALQQGLNWSGRGTDVFATTYESNILYTLRFMVDNDISGGQWLALKAPNYSLRPSSQHTTHCQYEVDVHFSKLEPKSPLEGDWGRLAPMRILSFDIECFAEVGFPEVRCVAFSLLITFLWHHAWNLSWPRLCIIHHVTLLRSGSKRSSHSNCFDYYSSRPVPANAPECTYTRNML